ncbi:MAG: thioredoxin [Patescibacteria group bacterium]
MSEIQITDSNFQKQIKKNQGLMLVDFWAPWCGPCQMMSPIIQELSKEYKGKVKIAKLNVDENKQAAQEYQVMSIPTLIIFKNGEETQRMVGAHDKETLKEKLDTLL